MVYGNKNTSASRPAVRAISHDSDSLNGHYIGCKRVAGNGDIVTNESGKETSDRRSDVVKAAHVENITGSNELAREEGVDVLVERTDLAAEGIESAQGLSADIGTGEEGG